ncbi:hypothetical protein GCM10020229_67070 [Kitasatospora albolonga]|uniref:hypothetical protein n=1 Tax=Kitasatospora albolonga TaxID=68173 RepID=UPI0031EA8E42
MSPRLLLDLDHIVRMVHPVLPAKTYLVLGGPATLVFEEVWDVQAGLDFKDLWLELELDRGAQGSRRRTAAGRSGRSGTSRATPSI